jgi:hypothetical protein
LSTEDTPVADATEETIEPVTETPADPASPPVPAKVDISFSRGLAPFLASHAISLAFSSSQSGRL